MNKLRKGYGVRTEKVVIDCASVRMSNDIRFLIGCLCVCAAIILFCLPMFDWSRKDSVIGLVLGFLWTLAAGYMFVTFAHFSEHPQSHLNPKSVKKEMSTTLARPITAEGEEIIRRTKNLMPDKLEIITQRTAENYKAFILLLFAFYCSFILYGLSIDELSEAFVYVYPLVCLGVVGTAALVFLPGLEINLKAISRMLYLILIVPVGFTVIFIYGITDNVWLTFGIIVGTIVMVIVMMKLSRTRKPCRKYTFPTSIKEKKEDEKE